VTALAYLEGMRPGTYIKRTVAIRSTIQPLGEFVHPIDIDFVYFTARVINFEMDFRTRGLIFLYPSSWSLERIVINTVGGNGIRFRAITRVSSTGMVRPVIPPYRRAIIP
jgi:hypothetical protein